MKVAIYKSYGSPNVLQIKEVDKPIPKENELLIKLSASTVTTVDSIFRKGDQFFARVATGITKPKNEILGTEFSGEVIETGKNVTRFKKGDLVFGAADDSRGTYSEYYIMHEEGPLVSKPDNLSMEEAAAVPSGALTALPFLRDSGKIKKGDEILIIGASGSVGSFGVQLAKYFEAKVTGVCSTSNVDLVKSIGADDVIDYKKEDFARQNKKYDIIFDSIGMSSFKTCKKLLSENGIYLNPVISLKILFQMMWTSKASKKKAIITFTGLRPNEEKKKDLVFLSELVEAGKLKPVIDKIYPFEQIAEAHKYVDKGHKKGNVVIRFDQQ
ncbi:MAG: NAD(P)-dependent alcohol dehydrogenase [Melioribacteraceae bacterium]|nr:NAD(P)-dependent alcohol dehydrogenase [Melioribacteraceae bacterium]